jgi:hypothetical protein
MSAEEKFWDNYSIKLEHWPFNELSEERQSRLKFFVIMGLNQYPPREGVKTDE